MIGRRGSIVPIANVMKGLSVQFQFNSDNQVEGDTAMAERVEQMARARLGRIEQRLTRVEVHVGDVDGPRDGVEGKRCAVEVRPAGMSPISATDRAASVEAAVNGAVDKVLAAYDRQVGKRTSRKGH